MATVDFGEYVHELNGRWIVAELCDDGRYYAYQRPEVQRLTGCSQTFGPLAYVAGDGFTYARRSDALRKARELYGEPGP